MAGLEAGADHKHVEPDAELGADIEHALGLGRKQGRREIREEQAQQRGPKHDAGDHFTNDLRLGQKLLAQPADDAASQQDDGQLQEEMDGIVAGRITGLGGRRGDGRTVRRQYVGGGAERTG